MPTHSRAGGRAHHVRLGVAPIHRGAGGVAAAAARVAPRPLTAGHQERLGTGLAQQSAISAVQWRQLKVPATLDG